MMATTKFSKTLTFFLITLFCCSLDGLAAGPLDNASWEQYRQAAKQYERGDLSKQLVARCERLRDRTQDRVLYARVSLLLAQVLEQLHDYRGSRKVLQDLYERRDNVERAFQHEARLRDALLYLAESKIGQAVPLLSFVMENGPNVFLRQEARIALAWYYSDVQNWQAVDSLLTQILTEHVAYGEDERVLIIRARSNIADGQPEAAIELLEQSSSKTALKYLAQAYELHDQPMMAVAVFKKIFDLHPNTIEAEEALFHAGEVFMNSEDWLAARAQYNQLLDRFPETSLKSRIYFRLGWIYLELDKIDQALSAFRSSTVSQGQPYFDFMEAECLRRLGAVDHVKYRQAILKYNRIVALQPNSPLAPKSHLKAALTMLETGAREDAVISLKQFLALYPKNELAPAVTFLLANQTQGNQRQTYFEEILRQYAGTPFYDAALVVLQNKDYERGNYQEVINRSSRAELLDQENVESLTNREHHLVLGESAYYLKHYDQARQEYASVRGADEDDLSQKAALGEAWCLLQTGKPDSAALQFETLRQRFEGEKAVRASFGLATAYFRMKEFAKAIENYPIDFGELDAPELKPIAMRSLYRLGESYFRLEYYTQAIETWEQLAEKYPNSELAPYALFKIADTYFLANHFEESVAALGLILDRYSDHPLAAQSMLKTAQSRFNAGYYNKAIADFEKFLESHPEHRSSNTALEGIQLCYYQLGQTDQAAEALQRLIEKAPNEMLAADARYRLAQSQLDAEQYEQAIQSFKEILTLYPGSSYARDAQFALAQAYYLNGDYVSANNEFSRFIQYFPSVPRIPEAVFKLAVGYFNEQSYLTALDYFNRIAQEFPDSQFYEPALQNIGWCYQQLGQTETAFQSFEQYLNAFPASKNNRAVILQLAKMKADSGDTDSAITDLKNLQALGDNVSAEAAYLLGTIYLATEQWAAAKHSFQTAMQCGSENNDYRLNAMSQLAALYESEQDWPNAIATYEMLIASATEQSWIDAAQQRIQALTPIIASSSENE